MKTLLLRYGPYRDLAGWRRGLIVSLVAAVFLTLSGAFGTGGAGWTARLAYWVLLMLLGLVWGSLVAQVFLRSATWGGRRWLGGLAASVVMAAPFTVVVWFFSNLMLDAQTPARALPLLFFSVLAVALVMTALNLALEGRRAAAEAPPPPKFLARLPLKLRGAEVFAVEAEDHYLRLHTSRGQDLILMRLADAVAELEGIEGMQVHRSWWVARDAITRAKRGDGRATLTLRDGSRVPVSRTYAGALRERGWL